MPGLRHTGTAGFTVAAALVLAAGAVLGGARDAGAAGLAVSSERAGITVSPDLVGSQQLPATFQVTPENFVPGYAVTLTDGGASQQFSQGPGGTIDFTDSPPCGTQQVELSEFAGRITASAPLEVLCPAITLSPAAFPQVSQPVLVQVTGSQFGPDQPVTIALDGTAAGSAVPNADGNFSLPITAAGLGCGRHEVTASEQAGPGGATAPLSASAALRVTRCRLTLSIDPAVLEPGQVTEVTGTGFRPGAPVSLTWQRPGGAPLLGALTVSAGPGGGISGFFLVLPGDLPGPRQLVASQGAVTVSAGAIVDSSPMQPSAGGLLIFRGD